MIPEKSIVITGATGFIGSCLTCFLNEKGYDNLILVDDFIRLDKLKNLTGKKYIKQIDRNHFLSWASQHVKLIDCIVHLGAKTDTTESSWEILNKFNLQYTQSIWNLCTGFDIPFIYASSAATYGNGELGYDDADIDLPDKLQPLNLYGKSKNEFDKWALRQIKQPPFWAGLKFFNVYGPNEYHKSRMASVIFHVFQQIKITGKVNLFRSHHPDFNDGMQLRDFVYVKDAVAVILFFIENRTISGIYNIGTGKARSFLELANYTFHTMGTPENIEFIDIPNDIKDKYQYYTQANINKLRESGYRAPFWELEEGIKDYVENYLIHEKYC